MKIQLKLHRIMWQVWMPIWVDRCYRRFLYVGGTRLLPALSDLYSFSPARSKRDIFIFTDGIRHVISLQSRATGR